MKLRPPSLEATTPTLPITLQAMSNMNILISGSGIAGSVFAVWLLRAYPNASITILERDGALRLTGASVDIRNAAVDIIKWMGTEEEIRRQTTKEEGIQIVDLQGKPVATFGATGRDDIQSITSEFEIFRGELAKIFLNSIARPFQFVFDDYVDHYEQDGDGVTVTFAKSKEIKKYDLLVAADGLGSKIRGIMLNTKPKEQFHDEGVYLAYFTIDDIDLLEGSRLAKGLNFPGGIACWLRPDPTGRTRAMLMFVCPSGESEIRNKIKQAMSQGNEQCMQLLEESFKDVGWLLPEVLRGMRKSKDFYFQAFGQIRSPRLQSGRVVLLGDAGYATPGIGTSLAIIGGYVLAGELMSHGADIGAALDAYEKIMLPFAKSEQHDGGWGMRLMIPQTQMAINIRNVILSFVSWAKLDQWGMLIAYRLGFGEKKVAMPDYQWPANSCSLCEEGQVSVCEEPTLV